MSALTPPAREQSGSQDRSSLLGLPRSVWLLALVLGALGLARPLLKITGVIAESGPVAPQAGTLIVTVVLTCVWALVAGLSRVPRPLLTLVLAGLVYTVLSIALSGVLSPILDGELRGPLTAPLAIPAVLATNACWGAAAGLLALGIRRLRGGRTQPPARTSPDS